MKHGFKLVKKEYLEYYKTDGYLYRHKTGLEVLFLDTKDKELFFSFSFKTLPETSNGVFHIIEHTVLSGSEKYDVKDLFSTLASGSASTYLNAFTCPDRTMYIAASAVKKDFDNIFSVYADSVFAPLLSKGSFLTEGIRLEEDGHFDGVVFNEMSGDRFQHDSVVSSSSTRSLFSSGPYSKDSGGDAREIATLTYEEFLATYKKYYSPTNCKVLLYGHEIDIDSKLEFLDREYLSKKEKTKELDDITTYDKWEERKFLVKESSSSGTTLSLSFLTENRNTSNVDLLFTTILVDILLGSPTCPLYKAILDFPLCEDLSNQSGIITDFYFIPFVIGLTGVKKEDIKKCEDFLYSTFSSFVKDGLDKDIIKAAMRRNEFAIKEIPGGIPNGLRATFKVIRAWERGLNPFVSLDPLKDFKTIQDMYDKDPLIFEKWIQKNILDNKHVLSLYVKQNDDVLKKHEEELNILAAEKAKLGFDIKTYYEYVSKEDSEEEISRIPHIKFSDIENKIIKTDNKFINNIITKGEVTGDIVYFDIAFDLSDKTNEELRLYTLLTRELPLINLDNGDEIHKKLRLLTGGYSVYIESGLTTNNDIKVSLVFRAKFISSYMKEVLPLLFELLTKADVSPLSNIKNALSDINTDFNSNIEHSGSSYASSLSLEGLTPSCALAEEVMGLNSYKYFSSVDEKDIQEALVRMYRDLNNKNRITVHITADDENLENVVKNTKTFISLFNEEGEIKTLKRTINNAEDKKQYLISSPVAYNALSFLASPWATKEQESEHLLCLMLTSSTLWNEIRVLGGAYGVDATLDSIEGYITITTYRDPHTSESYQRIEKAIKDIVINEENLEKAKIQAVGRLLKPLPPTSLAIISLRRHLYNISDEDRKKIREFINEITSEDIKAAQKRFIDKIKDSHRATLASLELSEIENLNFIK